MVINTKTNLILLSHGKSFPYFSFVLDFVCSTTCQLYVFELLWVWGCMPMRLGLLSLKLSCWLENGHLSWFVGPIYGSFELISWLETWPLEVICWWMMVVTIHCWNDVTWFIEKVVADMTQKWEWVVTDTDWKDDLSLNTIGPNWLLKQAPW